MSVANRAQNEAWNGDSGHRWVADADRRDAVLAPIADALLTAADLNVGKAVLDSGCARATCECVSHIFVGGGDVEISRAISGLRIE